MAPKASPTFTGPVSVPGLTSTCNLACGTNSVTCGTLTCTTGTLGGNTIATTNQIPSLTGYATLASPTFTGTVSIPGATCSAVLNFPNTMNYNVPAAATHKLYCGTTVYASIASGTTTFNNNVTCGSNSLTCGNVNYSGTVTASDSSYGGVKLSIINVLQLHQQLIQSIQVICTLDYLEGDMVVQLV